MPTNWKAGELYCSRPLWKDIPRNSSYSAAGSASKSTKSTTERENPLNKESPQTKSHSAAIVANKGDLRAEEILEMQKRVLQKLARRENIVKGYQDGKCSVNGEKMENIEASERSTTLADLEEWKRKQAQALHIIWGWH
jgi:hypothetical protein